MYKTEQEEFWAGEFGTNYIERNHGDVMIASNLSFFVQALRQAEKIHSCIELGANIGMNLKALKLLYPNLQAKAIEINANAAKELTGFLGEENVFNGSMFDWQADMQVDLALSKGVLIHINPDLLHIAYQKLYDASSKYILICEYYNPSPVAISYRGHDDRLYKRDFAGDMLDKFDDLTLLDYGFSYRRDPVFPSDDITWFLLKKK